MRGISKFVPMLSAFTLLRRSNKSVIPVLAMVAFMLGSLWLMSAATENSGQFGRMHLALVVINILGLIVLVSLISFDVLRLARQYQRKAAGSRLTAKLVAIFSVMAVVPVSIVFYFSLGFLQYGIDSWFDVRIERAMEDAIKLSRASLDMRMRDLLKQTREMSASLAHTSNELALFDLNDLRDQSEASELTLMTQSGRVIASSSANPTAIIPQRPDEVVLLQVRETNSYVSVAPINDLGLHIRVAVRVDAAQASADPRVLFALYPLDERIGLLADGVQSAFAKYKELVFLREPLKQSFTITLVLVLLVTLMCAVWAGFFFAQRLVAPIRVLEMGTRAVAAGNYQKKLPDMSGDELGSLVQSFAKMTDRISAAQEEVKRSRYQAERERSYLSAVLGRLSSGVITLGRDQTIRATNVAANLILGTEMEHARGSTLKHLEHKAPELQAFIHALVLHIDNSDKEWREEVVLFSGGTRKTLMCQGSQLPAIKDMPGGYVVVFDDVSALIQAQRDAAWGEVARRLAHEIKNPLTPIQLSAERLRHKYLHKMSPEDAEVLDRSTHTIVQQVQAMKEMVQAFTEYARAPKLQLKPLTMQTVIEEVLDLYRGDEQGVVFEFQAAPNVAAVEADPGRLRQLLHNLLRNALESLAEQAEKHITLSLATVVKGDQTFVELRVMDNGPGIPEELLPKLFEPYVTTKVKGSGLGLAVVKRIVEEHSGVIFASNREQGGACVVVRLPAITGTVRSLESGRVEKDKRRKAL